MANADQIRQIVESAAPMAFPGSANLGEGASIQWHGMTLRDYFAGQWLAGFAANHAGQMAYSDRLSDDEAVKAVAWVAYDHADAMLKAREDA